MMSVRRYLWSWKVYIILVTVLANTLVLIFTTVSDTCNCDRLGMQPYRHPRNVAMANNGHQLAVVVPFRDRFEELLVFVPHMDKFLKAQNIPYKFYIINQMDILRFNRGALINVGFLESQSECDYMAMHDVDLLPVNSELSYGYPSNGPHHIASPTFHPKYNYSTFIGGILVIRREHFQKVNGLSNRYWGWGKEDDELYVRLMEAELQISRPVNITSRNNTLRHVHDKRRRPRDNKRYFNQRNVSRHRDRDTGLDTLRYSVLSKHSLSIEGASVTVLNVELMCDLSTTPWCITPETYDIIEEFQRAQKAGEIGLSVEELQRRAKQGEPARKYVFKENLDLHNFIFSKELNNGTR